MRSQENSKLSDALFAESKVLLSMPNYIISNRIQINVSSIGKNDPFFNFYDANFPT